MAQFSKLLRLLQKELIQQEKILSVLSKERAAIVKLNKEELDKIGEQKKALLEEAIALERQRSSVYGDVASEVTAEPNKSLKFNELIEFCTEHATKHDLAKVGGELKTIVESVKTLNDGNGTLIKQCMGLIASTVSILTCKPETDLPTYGASGKLNGEQDPAFSRKGGRTSHSV